MKRVLCVLMCVCLASMAQAGIITSQLDAPTVGAEDIAQLSAPATSDSENILGTGQTFTGNNDGATYVAGDRLTQGQTFEMTAAGTVQGIWVKHVLYTDGMDNGTWSGLNDGTSLTVRISSVSETTLTVLSSEVATVSAGSGIGGGGNIWGGTGKWLYIDLDTPVALVAGLHAFDLTSYGPWFELAGLEAGPYADGSAYTTASKEALDMGTVYADGDRTFVVDVIPEPATLILLGLGGLMLRRKR